MGLENRQPWQQTPKDHSHPEGHSRPGRGPPLIITLDLCPLPPGRWRAAEKVYSSRKDPPGRHCQDPYPKLSDTLVYLGFPVCHFDFFFF